MSDINDFDNFNFSGHDELNEDNSKEKKNPMDIMDTFGKEEYSNYGNLENSLNDNLGNSNDFNFQNDQMNNLYIDVTQAKGSEESLNTNNNIHKNNKGIQEESVGYKRTVSLTKCINLPRKDSKMSFENSYEYFFEKDSDLSESEEGNIWETERLKRIEERKEFEKIKKKEIKAKAAEDLKKWYEEMAIEIEEKKKLFNKEKTEEEKKEEEELENKPWTKVSKYLDFEKGDYFKEDSRIKQILLKLIKQENS